MRRTPVLVAAASAAALVIGPAWGANSGLKLNPDGFGPHTYSAWKAGQGEADDTGGANQALYFQKMAPTTTNAAALAVFSGVAGMTAEQVGQLAFDWRMDGHCGAGAPRFNITFENAPTVFIGCQGMTPEGQTTDSQGRTWERRSIDLSNLGNAKITSLAIVFDEGTDQGQGYVYLDNIEVGGKIWTNAADNGRS